MNSKLIFRVYFFMWRIILNLKKVKNRRDEIYVSIKKYGEKKNSEVDSKSIREYIGWGIKYKKCEK